MTPYNRFLTNLIRIRTDRNLTQRETAAQCRINNTAYGRLEQGECEFTIGLLNEISDGLGANSTEFLKIDKNQIPMFSYYENCIVTEDMGEVRTWGIAVCSKTNTILSESGTFTFYYSNLTTEKDDLVDLVDLMNREKLSLAHVEDVIMDFIVATR